MQCSLHVFELVPAEKDTRSNRVAGRLSELTCVPSLLSFLPLHQLGTFRSPEGEYFVEPLHSYQGEHYEEEHTKPHIVYRKTAAKKRSAEEEESSACDASGGELPC